MKMTVSKQKAKNRSVKFALKATDAKEVYLVGDFNNWTVGAHHMKNDGKGIWTKTVLLPEGEFGYKFFVDNQWLIDPQNERVCLNCFGSYNNIVRVNI